MVRQFQGGGGRGYQRRGNFRERSGSYHQQAEGPPQSLKEIGTYQHSCEGDLVCKSNLQEHVPWWNKNVYFENKAEIGKVDEILGHVNDFWFTVKPSEGIKEMDKETKIFIDSSFLHEKTKFINPQRGGRGGRRGGGGRRFGGGGGGRRGGGGFANKGRRGNFRGRR